MNIPATNPVLCLPPRNGAFLQSDRDSLACGPSNIKKNAGHPSPGEISPPVGPQIPRSGPRAPATQNKNVTMSFSTPIVDLDPTKLWNIQHFVLASLVYQRLMQSTEGGVVGDLATRCEVSNDGRSYTFYINPAAKFHDGSPVTTLDVQHSLAVHLWPQSTSIVGGFLKAHIVGAGDVIQGQVPEGIKILSSHAIRIDIREAYPAFLELISIPGFSIFKRGTKFDKPEGSGRMKGAYDSKSQSWELKEFSGYTGQATSLKELRIIWKKFLKNNDVYMPDVALGIDTSSTTPDYMPDGYSASYFDICGYNHLFFNTQRPPFTNAKFRKDFTRLLHSEWRSAIRSPWFAEQEHYFPRGLLTHDYDKVDKSDSFSCEDFRQKWSTKVNYGDIVVVMSASFFTEEHAVDLEKILKMAGVSANVVYADRTAYAEALSGDDYHLISGAYVANFRDPDSLLEPLNSGNPMRFGRFESQQLIQQLTKARYISHREDRLAAYADIMLRFEAEYNFIPMFRIGVPVVHRNSVNFESMVFSSESAFVENLFK